LAVVEGLDVVEDLGAQLGAGRPGTSALPTVALSAATSNALSAGASIPVIVTVSVDQHYEGIDPASTTRRATLQLAGYAQPSA
jgi:hypothetical protein